MLLCTIPTSLLLLRRVCRGGVVIEGGDGFHHLVQGRCHLHVIIHPCKSETLHLMNSYN